MNFPLALSFLQNLIVVLFILLCATIILVILLQKGRGGGISGAFGGGGGAGSLLGTKTGDFLTWVTICLVAAFLVMAVLMGKFLRPSISSDLGTMTPPPAASQPATEIPTGDVDASMPTAPVETPADEAAAPVEDIVDEAAATETPAEPVN